MKKKLLLLVLLLTSSIIFSQINITTSWPDTNWTISGTYAAGNLLDNPTLATGGSSDFKFDDTQVSNVGDIINLDSPIIDLSSAASGETGLLINFKVAYTISASELLEIEYWDADAGLWKEFPGGSQADPATVGDYTNCSYDPVNSGVDQILDFSNFTNNQKQNFKVRFVYKDGNLSSGTGGLCMSAPTFTSLSCNAPTNLNLASVGTNGAQIGWTSNNGEGDWQIDYGLAGFNHTGGTVMNTNQNPTGISSLTQNTGYDAYVRADCSGGDGLLLSPWSTKFNFTTTATCPKPNTGVAGGITTTTADISWLAGGGETSWNVEYGFKGYVQGSSDIIGQFSTNDNTSNALTNLLSGQQYDFYVQAFCGTGSTSDWAGPFTFSTIWLNLELPQSGTINVGDTFTVYAQIQQEGVTDQTGQGAGISAWIGYNSDDTDPLTWSSSNWVVATFSGDLGNSDEYKADIGSVIPSAGTYYYASKFSLTSGEFYGGYNGGPWDGSTNVSGILTVNSTLGVKDHAIEGFSFYPNPIKTKITLTANQNIDQIEIYNLLGQNVLIKQPNVSHYDMQLNNLKTGIYFMKVQVGSKVGNYKIIKQ